MLLRKVVAKVLGQDPDLIPFRIIGLIGIPAIIGLGELRERAFDAWDPLLLRLPIACYLGIMTIGSYIWDQSLTQRLFLIFYYIVTIWVSCLSAVNDSYGYTANLIVVVATGMIVVIKDNRNLLIYSILAVLIPSVIHVFIQANHIADIIFSFNLFINVIVLYSVSLAKIRITDKAKDEIKRLAELKEDIINSVNEKIKHPLADVLDSVDELSKTIKDIDPILLKKEKSDPQLYLSYIMNSVSDIMSIVDSTTTLNSIRSKTRLASLETLSLKELIDELISFHLEQDQGLHIIKTEMEEIKGRFDRELIFHAIDSLIDNALIYSVSGTTVTIKLFQQKGKAIIEIADQGIGIPEQDKTKIFDEFYRGSNVGLRQGIGLGLTVAKESIELHSGTVTFKSIEDQTVFTITLPVE